MAKIPRSRHTRTAQPKTGSPRIDPRAGDVDVTPLVRSLERLGGTLGQAANNATISRRNTEVSEQQSAYEAEAAELRIQFAKEVDIADLQSQPERYKKFHEQWKSRLDADDTLLSASKKELDEWSRDALTSGAASVELHSWPRIVAAQKAANDVTISSIATHGNPSRAMEEIDRMHSGEPNVLSDAERDERIKQVEEEVIKFNIDTAVAHGYYKEEGGRAALDEYISEIKDTDLRRAMDRRLKTSISAVEAEASRNTKTLAVEAETEHQRAIIAGDTSKTRISAINNDQRLASDPDAAIRLIKLAEDRNEEAIKQGQKSYTIDEIHTANVEIQTAIRERNPDTLSIIAARVDKLAATPAASVTKASGYSDEFLKLKDTPEDSSLKHYIGAVDGVISALSTAATGSKKKRATKIKDIERRGASIKAEMDKIDASDTTPSQKQNQYDILLDDFAKEAAKESTRGFLSLYKSAFLWTSPTTAPTMIIRAFQKKAARSKAENLSDEELQAIIDKGE